MSEILNKAAETAASAIMRFKAKTAGRYYPGYHEDMRDAVKRAILAADVAADPDLSSELDRLREENERLRIDEDRYRAFIRDVQMLAYKWQEAHDCLKAGLPYSFPSPSDLPECDSENARLREALQKAETVIDLMADVVTYDATMQGPKILGVNGSAARRASEAARNYFIAKDRVKP